MIENLPIVAIVGQPNAGKSSLLNKIAGKPLAVTSDVANTTRDRQYVNTIWSGTNFTLVDTAGLALENKGELELSLLKQIEIAVLQADVIILVVDGKQPVNALSQEIIKKFRQTKKPLLLAVNKLDSAKTQQEKLIEFQKLGIKPMFGISSISGLGLGDLLDAVLEKLPVTALQPETETGIAVSIVGKPNVGKSSLFNAILKEERVVVSPLPGTTRTAIDSHIKIQGIDYTFIDTAGLKKKEYRQEQPDVFSGFQTFKAIRRSDVCLFVIDSIEELTKQDQRVASEIFAMEKGCIVLANKMDLYQGDEKKMLDYISHHLPFLWMCPVFFVSAVTGEGLSEAISAIKPIFEKRQKKVDDEILHKFLTKMLKTNPPKLLRDQKHPKVFSLHQRAVNPPAFELVVNHPAAISQQFRKFVENGIIKTLDFWGTPIVFRLKGKDKT